MFQHQIRLTLLAVLAAFMLALSGCGGGSSPAPAPPEPPEPMVHSVDLSGVDAHATAGTAMIQPGEMATIGDITFTCAAGGDPCSIAVEEHGDHYDATSTGGMATAANSEAYNQRTMPVAVDLSGVAADAMRGSGAVTLSIAAGENATIGEITYSCAAGDHDCSVMVAADGTAMSTGGMVTAANSAAYVQRTTPMDVDLSGVGADAMRGTGSEVIAPGASATIGEITYTCPAGGHACSVMVDANGMATSAGGLATAANSEGYTQRTTPMDVDLSDVAEDADRGEGGTVQIAAGASGTIGEVTYTCAAGGHACSVTVDEHGQATSLGGMVTMVANSEGYDTRKADEASATAAAATKETEIATEAAQTTDAGLGGTDATIGDASGNYQLASIERDHDATTVTITVHGDTDADDENFMQAEDLMDGRIMLTRTMDADDDGNVVQEVVIVGTDIEAPKAVEFAKFESDLAGTTPQELNVSTDTTNDDPAATNEALRVVDANIGMVKAGAFTAPAGTVAPTILSFQQAVADDTGTADVDESRDAAEIMGTFNGAMGTYVCTATGAACTVTVNTDGVVSAISGQTDWAFIPNMGATTDQSDYDYLHYGFWLKKTEDSDGAVTYNEVETFQGSSAPATGDVSAVDGTATYDGDAVGVYVHRTYDTDGTSDATSGHFKADVSLTATFDQTTDQDIAPNRLNMLTGTIDNFDLSGDEGNSWSVALSGAIDPGAATAAGTAKGGVGDGSFNATFYGTITPDGTTNISPAPGSVAGEFNAGFYNGSVAGAFGARKE